MKLITEQVEEVQYITEKREDGKKNYYITGIFLESAVKNRNGRLYPEEIMDSEVARYTAEAINDNRAYGELGHPPGPGINLHLVSHMIKELKKDGTQYIGKALVTETPMGKIVQNLIDAGAGLGVSSRGLGTLTERNGIMEVQKDFRLATAADIVADPSAPNAFVKGIMEEVDWWYDISKDNWKAVQVVDQSQTQLRSASLSQITEQKLQMFQRFVNTLAEN